MRLTNVIYNPIITEKGAMHMLKDTYLFKVNRKATKGAVAKAIEDFFKVNVIDVRTSVVPGKKVRIKKTARFTKTESWKKAMVTIKTGQKIEMFTHLMGGEK
ncbi:50S ribosomal protein L23 [candidate division WWE3 bacterium]|nr:50S ribosomal protein L23 [candidate division WWE3 bacterium]